jgi:hypothetical protein
VEVPGSSIATSLVLCSCDPHAVDGSDIVFALSALGDSAVLAQRL